MPETRTVIGWDVGGAHLKASLLEGGRVTDAAEWACPLWQGLDRLHAAIGQAASRWPEAVHDTATAHALTMTGEMVDLFDDRGQGVLCLAALMQEALVGSVAVYAGASGWCGIAALAMQWQAVASANWHATAAWVARTQDAAVLVDIGSTTTDLIAVRGGRARSQGQDDAGRLASGELVYHGVVRTPLCALAPRVVHRGVARNVMNEFFATTADVHRLTGELDAAHDLHPAADGQGKDLAATRRRLARMIGLDARDASDAEWLALAQHWRELQLDEIGGQLDRVLAAGALPEDAPLVGAGCGDFLASALAERCGRPYLRFAELAVGGDNDALKRRVQVAAPSAAVALLLHSRHEAMR